MKYCKRCDKTLSKDSFGKALKRYDGMQAYCKLCMKLYRREHYYLNKQQYLDRNRKRKDDAITWLREQKDNPCSDCGNYYPNEPWLMEYDHLSDDKRKNVAALVSYGIETLKIEIEKCDLVCVLCHRRRTAKRAGWVI